MRGVEVSMSLVATMRTGEVVPLADSQQPAPGAGPARVGRVDFGDSTPTDLRLVLHSGPDFASLPEGETPPERFAPDRASLGLRDAAQVLENEHRSGRSPLDERRGRLPGEGAGARRAAKPFEHKDAPEKSKKRPWHNNCSVEK